MKTVLCTNGVKLNLRRHLMSCLDDRNTQLEGLLAQVGLKVTLRE